MGEWETLQPTKKAPIEDLNSVEGFPAEQLPLSTDAEVTCGALDFVHYCKGNTAGMQWKLQLCIAENSSLLTVCYMSTLESRQLEPGLILSRP